MQLNYSKYADGLIPAIVQDAQTGKVLMLGFMNEEALMHTQQSGLVTFYSRSKQRLWTKGRRVAITCGCKVSWPIAMQIRCW